VIGFSAHSLITVTKDLCPLGLAVEAAIFRVLYFVRVLSDYVLRRTENFTDIMPRATKHQQPKFPINGADEKLSATGSACHY
jgi:hypothetical protein